MITKQRLESAGVSVLKSMKMSIPVLIGVILLISLVTNLVPKKTFSYLFRGNLITDVLTGGVIGSVAAGNPLTSYVIGGELLKQGISFAAVTAFILGWVTVGMVQLPAESLMLGKKFALLRNGLNFLMALVIAVLTVLTLGVL
jgi:uncharacterized membrane protein YraQ (UPF0718 family)